MLLDGWGDITSLFKKSEKAPNRPSAHVEKLLYFVNTLFLIVIEPYYAPSQVI